jgi:WD40 repeat protein
VYDVVAFDMMGMLKLAFSPGCCAWIYGRGEPVLRLAVADAGSCSVHVFDAASGALVGSLMPHLSSLYDLAFAPDGRTLFTADNEHLRISDVVTRRTFDELVPGWTIQALASCADGRRVVVGGMGSLGRPANERAKLAVLELDAK